MNMRQKPALHYFNTPPFQFCYFFSFHLSTTPCITPPDVLSS